MSGSIKYVFIGDLSSKKTNLEVNYQNIVQAEQDTKQIFERLCSLNDKNFEEQIKVPNKNGNYFFTCLLPNKFYMILADSNYKESVVFDLITQVHNSSIYDSLDNNEHILEEGKNYLKNLIDKFENPKSIISDVDNNVNDNEIKIETKGNLRNLTQSKENADEHQLRSKKIKEGTHLFTKNTKEIKKVKCWKNSRLITIIVLIVFGILLIIIIPILVTSKTTETA